MYHLKLQELCICNLQVDASGEIVCLAKGGCPWKEHLFRLEKELEISPPIKYVLYPDQSNKWRIQCVSVRADSFENRYTHLYAHL